MTIVSSVIYCGQNLSLPAAPRKLRVVHIEKAVIYDCVKRRLLQF